MWPEKIYLFAQVALSIFLEAAPFLLLGSLLSALLEKLLDPSALMRRLPRRPLAGAGLGLLAGLILPTCECGVVPVARRLLDKGAPGPAVVTYMLSAPVINPVVLLSTYVAFQRSLAMVAARVAVVAVVALVVGLATGRRLEGQAATSRVRAIFPMTASPADGGPDGEAGGRALAVMVHAAEEFLSMGKYLIFGCLAAASFKVFVPWSTVRVFEDNVFLAVALMMALAVLLSVCSEADAFVAASYVSFPVAGRLAFVCLGPMVDLKLMAMYLSSFDRRLALTLIAVPPVLVYPLSLLAGMWLG